MAVVVAVNREHSDNNSIGFIIAIDNQIYDLIRAYQKNAYTLRKVSKDEFIRAYQENGLHNINFDKIFN